MQKDFTKMPKRVSSRADEVESKKVLQSEQIRNANMANAYLLYYLSGGNESVVASPKDKVRPEDQDLRGWFAEKYGDKYLQILTSDIECSKTNPERVKQIIGDFTDTPFGYILRTGAVNEYHLGRIVTYAKNVNLARAEAKKYSKELAMLCAKLLLSGEPPNNNIFSIMHSSIRTWYQVQGIEIKLTFEEHISKALVTGINERYNHATYLIQVITSIFDMLAFSKPAESWATGHIKTAIEELDGVTASSLAQYSINARAADNKAGELNQLVNEAEEKGWSVAPKMTASLKQSFGTMVNLVETQGYGNTDTSGTFQKMYIPVYQNLQAYKDAAALAIGAEVPRDLVYNFRLINIVSGQWSQSITTSLWYNYDQWQSLKDQRTEQEVIMQENAMSLQNSEANTKTLAQWHKTPAIVLYKELGSTFSAREDGSHIKADWIIFVYESVKQGLGLGYVTSSLKLKNVNGVAQYSPYPEVHINADPYVDLGLTEDKPKKILDGFNISRSILHYAKALSGVSPAAYWSASLSHRIVFRPRQPMDGLPARTEVYLYSANMKTGGIGSDNALISIFKGTTETAAGIISGLLPDIPEYKPGTNVQLSAVLNNSFSLKVSEDPSLQQWLRASMKDRFQYAYVIKSGWDPVYYVDGSPTYKPPSPYLGNSIVTHIDWLNATDYANQNFKGVKTLSPNINTLKFSTNAMQRPESWPTYFEAKGALSATTMTCVAYPKSAISKITAFMEGVPAKIQELLNRVNKKANSPNYDLANSLSPNLLYGDRSTLNSTWPQYSDSDGNFVSNKFLNEMENLRTFLLNRTESLFIDDIAFATKKAYDELSKNKPDHKKKAEDTGVPYGYADQHHIHYFTKDFDPATFGDTYTEYMGLLGAIAYFNSYEMLMDTPAHRTYAEWVKPFKGEVDRVVSSVIGGKTPIVIYQDSINDTEDVSILHQTLSALGTFEGMTEMPVFDVVDFNIMWTTLGSQASSPTSKPFDSRGMLLVGSDGLQASAYRGLKNGYGDVFHNTIMNACVMRPRVFFHTPPSMTSSRNEQPGYMYSTLRVPVNTRGVSSKVYGMRPGSVAAFNTGVNSIPGQMRLTGSGGLTYTGLAGMAGVVFAGALGVAMFKNIASETAFSDKRFRIDDIE